MSSSQCKRAMEFLKERTDEDYQYAAGKREACFYLMSIGQQVESLEALREICHTLADHAYDDLETEYYMSRGEKDFYEMAEQHLTTLIEVVGE